MKIKGINLSLALFMLGLAAPLLVTAQTAGQSASGTYQFSFQDGYTKYVKFDAKVLADGSITGSMFLSDEAPLYEQDVDGTGDPTAKESGFYVKAEFDGLMVNQNQAVMSGTIMDSSIRDYVGQRVLLAVEDNGDNTRTLDKLVWGIYRPVAKGWKPGDAELEEDPGVDLKWVATDAERKEDVGIKMPLSETVDTHSFPLSSYSFVDVERVAGDIRVQP